MLIGIAGRGEVNGDFNLVCIGAGGGDRGLLGCAPLCRCFLAGVRGVAELGVPEPPLPVIASSASGASFGCRGLLFRPFPFDVDILPALWSERS